MQTQLDRALSMIEQQQKDLKEGAVKSNDLTLQVGNLKNILESKVTVISVSVSKEKNVVAGKEIYDGFCIHNDLIKSSDQKELQIDKWFYISPALLRIVN